MNDKSIAITCGFETPAKSPAQEDNNEPRELYCFGHANLNGDRLPFQKRASWDGKSKFILPIEPQNPLPKGGKLSVEIEVNALTKTPELSMIGKNLDGRVNLKSKTNGEAFSGIRYVSVFDKSNIELTCVSKKSKVANKQSPEGK